MQLPELEKVVPEVLAKYVRQYGIKAAETSKGVKALSLVMKKAKVIAKCDVCGGDSDADLPECPFCGDSDTAPEDGAPKPIEEAMKKKTASKKTVKPELKKKTASKLSPPIAAAKVKPGVKPDKVIKQSTELVKADAIAKAGKTKAAEVITSAALAKEVTKVRELQLRGIECMWELGSVLFNIYEKKLYTQKLQGDTPLYATWTLFCQKELGITPKYGFNLMDVATHFTKKQVIDVGITKLTMLVRVPEDQREELLAKAKDTPRSKIAEEVAKLAGNTPRDTGRNAGFKGKPGPGRGAKDGVAPSKKLTVVRAEPQVVVQMFVGDTDVRAHDIEDAKGVETCANGMMIFYSIVKTEEGLSLVVETRRVI